MLRIVRWVTAGLIILFVVIWGGMWAGARWPDSLVGRGVRQVSALVGVDPVAGPTGLVLGGPFQLVGTKGQIVTDREFRGKWMLIYFGYTYCPDVCPTELQTLVGAVRGLGAGGDKIVPIFITIDPARDTPAQMAQYTALFSKRLVGLTGSPAQIAAAAGAFRVYYQKIQPKDGGAYLMDHSSFAYLVDPNGHFRELLPQGLTANEISTILKKDISPVT